MLMRVLCNGGRVEHEGYMYAMTEDGDLCTVCTDDKGEEFGMRMDCDLRSLVGLANDIGRDKLWLACCSIALREMNTNKKRETV